MFIYSDINVLTLFITRILRLFSYGCISVIFIHHLLNKGLTQRQMSILQTLIIVGDLIVSIYLTTQADKIGRRKTLVIGGLLKFLTGFTYAYSENYTVLIISGILGVISVSGGQIGPFMPIQQSCLTQIIEAQSSSQKEVASKVASIFSYYNMAGYLSQAGGAFFSGYYIQYAKSIDSNNQQLAMINIMILYGLLGLLKTVLYCLLGKVIQAKRIQDKKFINFAGIKKQSVKTITTLSLLFAFDAWAGGLVMQSYLSYYYDKKYSIKFVQIGMLLSICNIVGGVSGILSAKLVDRFGAMATMIFTHLPSNVFLILIPFCDSFLAQFWLILRFCISQMDVPARQTYVTMVVSSEERSAANGITNIARSLGLSLSFPIAAIFIQQPPQSLFFSFPFIIAGVSKILYDITLGFCFLWNKQKSLKKQQKFQQIQQIQESQFRQKQQKYSTDNQVAQSEILTSKN